MSPCPHCAGALRLDDDGLLVCWLCARVANAPQVDPTLYKGMKPHAPSWPPKTPGNPHPQRPYRRGAWYSRKLESGPTTGKTYVA